MLIAEDRSCPAFSRTAFTSRLIFLMGLPRRLLWSSSSLWLFHFSERSSTATLIKVVGKTVHATIPKGNMGYDQYTAPVAVESTFVTFL